VRFGCKELGWKVEGGRGRLNAIPQIMYRGQGLGYYPQVLKGVLLTGRFVIGSSFLVFGRFVYKVFGTGFSSWILVFDSCFWAFNPWALISWVLVLRFLF
jgi:hypothetical protein